MSERTEKIIKELGYEPAKSKRTQPQTPKKAQGRDLFQTPNYAVDLLVPFIPKGIQHIWEPAVGEGRISKRLEFFGYELSISDIRDDLTAEKFNFVAQKLGFELSSRWAIITNPPFSLKQRFYYKCLEYKVPFALLIPADYSGWLIDAVRLDGAEKIIPTRRIDFITPSGKSGATGNTSNFHSLWLTWGFGLGRTETFVELTNEQKKGNI